MTDNMSFLSKIFGDPNARVIKSLQPIVAQINTHEAVVSALTDEALKSKVESLKLKVKGGESLNDILPETFACIREAAKRAIGQRHFDVQLLGGIVLHRGGIAEMRTGEGKTLTATLPVALNALAGRGVHVVTVNDYLAKRDAAWMGRVYHALGLTVGCIQHESAFLYDPEKKEYGYLKPVSRGEAYSADITYGTNNEFGFDYLRDNMVMHRDRMAQRPFFYAIIDEVDSILIDEARTPLIISGAAEESADMYARFAQLVRRLVANEDYNIDEKMRSSTLTEKGIKKMEQLLGVENIYTAGGVTTVHHLEQALKAETLFKIDRDYVVREGEVVIVDEFTGRMMFGRRYSEGLHQAIEAKEGVKVQKESDTLATVTFQNYFRLYQKLAGMTGTAASEAEEFSKIYKLDVTVIPTNKPMVRSDLRDRVYKNETGKFQAVAAEVKERNAKGQPMLIGTISIEKNEQLSKFLEQAGIAHNILNAKNHEREAQILADAGRKGSVTLATNMAGRGVDIILGGAPPDPGQAIEGKGRTMEQWQAEHNEVVALGGLHVIGTERHESRRIDNQLRGRAGRQGDAGSSQFYVSMEDDLMRIFGSKRMQSIMERLGVPDDMPIEHGMLSKGIETAQHKVEGHNFDIRKHLLEYDDVLNKHREVIYKKRREILEAEDTKKEILSLVNEEIENVVTFHTAEGQEWNYKEIAETLATIFPPAPNLAEELQKRAAGPDGPLGEAQGRTGILDYCNELAVVAYEQMEARLAETGKKLGQDSATFLREIEKGMLLRAIDTLWVEHLDAMTHLRHGIGLRGYGQRDPLVEYKRESFRMFQELLALIRSQVVYAIYKVGVATQAAAPSLLERQGVSISAPAKTADGSASSSAPVAPSAPRVGRNDPCPCGSGKKFKKCHGI